MSKNFQTLCSKFRVSKKENDKMYGKTECFIVREEYKRKPCETTTEKSMLRKNSSMIDSLVGLLKGRRNKGKQRQQIQDIFDYIFAIPFQDFRLGLERIEDKIDNKTSIFKSPLAV